MHELFDKPKGGPVEDEADELEEKADGLEDEDEFEIALRELESILNSAEVDTTYTQLDLLEDLIDETDDIDLQ